VTPTKARPYNADKFASPPNFEKHTLTSLENDPASVAALEEQMSEWRAKARRIEQEIAAMTLSEQLGKLMFADPEGTMGLEKAKELPGQEGWQEKMKGGGMIVLGEFRQHVRSIGLSASNDEIDALFESWDRDKGGSIDSAELQAALLELRAEHVKRWGRSVALETQIETLRSRADAGQSAITATESATREEAELQALLADIDGRLGVQLGTLFVSRRIRVGEIVGSWCKTKGNAAKRELSRNEFKDEVRACCCLRAPARQLIPA
jgi:hypothetical protein